MGSRQGLLILGFGGHARSVADVALAAGYKDLLFIDPNARDGESFLGYPVRHTLPGALPEGWLCIAAVGDNRRRRSQIDSIREAGWPLATLIAPSATIGAGASVQAGSVIAHHAHIGPMAKIGTGTIVNTAAIVEHDCAIGDYVHVSVNAAVAGRSQLGDLVFLGAGAVVIDAISVGSEITVGAGGVVAESIAEPGVYVGVPARRIKDARERVTVIPSKNDESLW
jgi:UDP-N-acetylbacillosamine N-acetyltransferase